MKLLIIGGSDAGISAALRAREIDPDVNVTLVLADRYPNLSICGLPSSCERSKAKHDAGGWHSITMRRLGRAIRPRCKPVARIIYIPNALNVWDRTRHKALFLKVPTPVAQALHLPPVR